MQYYEVERLISKYFQELRMMPQQPMALPQPPANITVDTQPIADALLNGLTAVASSIEYKAQLEDARERELNKRDKNTPMPDPYYLSGNK